MKKIMNNLKNSIKTLRPFFIDIVNAIIVIFVTSCVIVTLAICCGFLVIVFKTMYYLLK